MEFYLERCSLKGAKMGNLIARTTKTCHILGEFRWFVEFWAGESIIIFNAG